MVASAGVLSPGAVASVSPGTGMATHYDSTGGGNCSLVGPPADHLDVALSHVEYGTADSCGGYLDVTGPQGTVRVEITNQCPECDVHHLDLSKTAFARIAPLADGQVPVSYTLVRNPPLASPIAIRVKEGSSRWWMQIQALHHGNPLARFELQTSGGGWRTLVHTDDNFWMAENPGPGDGPFTVRLTDIHGQSVTIPGIALSPNQVQPTTARLYGASSPAPPPPTTAAPTTAAPTTVPPTTTSAPTTTTTTATKPAARPATETAAVSPTPDDPSSAGAILLAATTFTLLAAAAYAIRRRA